MLHHPPPLLKPCRHGLESFLQGYLIHSHQNRCCAATQKMTAQDWWRHFLQQKLHCLIGPSIWWQMLRRMNSTTRWMHATLLWFLHRTWLRLVAFDLKWLCIVVLHVKSLWLLYVVCLNFYLKLSPFWIMVKPDGCYSFKVRIAADDIYQYQCPWKDEMKCCCSLAPKVGQVGQDSGQHILDGRP